jgi:hypothetical protein
LALGRAFLLLGRKLMLLTLDIGKQVIEIETKDMPDKLYEEALRLGITEMVKAGRFQIKPKGYALVPADLPEPPGKA